MVCVPIVNPYSVFDKEMIARCLGMAVHLTWLMKIRQNKLYSKSKIWPSRNLRNMISPKCFGNLNLWCSNIRFVWHKFCLPSSDWWMVVLVGVVKLAASVSIWWGVLVMSAVAAAAVAVMAVAGRRRGGRGSSPERQFGHPLQCGLQNWRCA